MTMQHPDIETLSSYIDGELSVEEAAQIEEHLSTCPQCQRELDELRGVSSLVRDLRIYQPRTTITVPSSGRQSGTGKVISLNRLVRPLAVAAIVIIVAVTGLRIIDEFNETEPSDGGEQAALTSDEDDGTELMDQASESSAGAPERERESADQPPPMAALPRQEEPNAAFAPAMDMTGTATVELPAEGSVATVAPTQEPGDGDTSDDRTTGDIVRMAIYVALGAAIVAGAFWTLYRRIRRDAR